MIDDIKFTILNNDGIEKTYLILDRFTKNNKNYLIYQEEENEEIYSALYEMINETIKIIPIEDDTDYNIVDEYLESL